MTQEKIGLPDNAKMVFKGKIYEIWQWEQEMYDGTKAIFEKIRRPDTVTVFAVVGDKLILQEQEQPHRPMFLSLPGGKCDENEDSLEAAKRELLEETGYVSENVVFWKKISMPGGIVGDKYYYIAKDCKKIGQLKLDSGEKIENRLIDFNELLKLSENEKFRDRDLSYLLMRMRLHPKEMNDFRKACFE